MSLQDLPIELLDAICQNVLPTDLVALSRTSSFIYPVAQRLLYRHLSVSPASHNLAVVVTLSKRPGIARFVRSFAISLDAYSPVFPSFYRRLATALTYMSELTSLDLFIDASANWVLQAAAAASIYPRLHHFACSFPFDTHVVDFLNRADALLELEVDSIPVSHPPPIPLLPLTSIPRLIQFTGSSQAAVAIVPGRPVESLHLNSGDLTEEDVDRLSKSTSRIVVLGSTTTEQPVPLLESLSQKMPYLVYLRIMTMYTFFKAPDAVSLSLSVLCLRFSHPIIYIYRRSMNKLRRP